MASKECVFEEKLMSNPFVYHYTSVDALFSILEEYRTNGCNALPFRASCIYNVNDTREMELGYTTIKSFLPNWEKNKKNNMHLADVYQSNEYQEKCKERSFKRPKDGTIDMGNVPFTISFCCKRDFLPMWSMYGDAKKGVSLKFKLNTLIMNDLVGSVQPCFVYYDGDRPNIIKDYLFPALYNYDADRASKELSIDDKIEELSLLCECVSPFVKTSDWSYESEFRLAYSKYYAPKINDDPIGKYMLIIDKVKVDKYITVPIDVLSLEEIIVGPLANYKVIEHVLRKELDECMLNNVDISPSSINIIK